MTKIERVFSIFRSEFRRGFLFILISKIFIAGVAFLTTPFVARLFTPEDYGLFALLNGVAIILAQFSTLTLPVSLVVVRQNHLKRTTTGIVTLIIFWNTLFFGGALVASYFEPVHHFIFRLTKIEITFYSCFLVILFSILDSFSQVFANINIREKDYTRNITVNILDNVSIKGSSLLIGVFKYTPFGLFYSELLGKIINILSQLSFRKFRMDFLYHKMVANYRVALSILKEQKHYPLYTFPVSVIGRFSGQLMLWVFAIYYSKQTVGHFTMGLGLLSMPLMLIANSMQPIIIKKLDEDRLMGRAESFVSLILKLGLLSGVIYSIFYIVSPWFVSIYLGERWLPSIEIIQLLCLPFAFQMISNSLDGAFIVYKKQKSQFYFKIFFLFLLFAIISIFAAFDWKLRDVVMAYGLVLLIEEVSKITYLIWISRHVRGN